MTIDTLKTAIAAFLPLGTKIKRVKHIDANNAMIDALYYSDWGIPKPYFSNVLPDGYVWCNVISQTVPIANCNPTFVARMLPMISVYGGDGITTIGIPYIKPGSSLIQSGVGVTTTFTLGASAGAEKHTLTMSEMPSHNFLNGMCDDTTDLFVYGGVTTDMPGAANGTIDGVGETKRYQGKTNTLGGDVAHENMPPYMVINYILRTV